ncbi:hypothetical protein E2C01_083250 [Portunus trituberculatus]|uniref:Uncharacterized protein n=1 Tax=Portunus trituberculatus TaxID=210409 RepID=A0A5B7J189_PORTR|nr:hypothetical protein [Portunus trituberculatus]
MGGSLTALPILFKLPTGAIGQDITKKSKIFF